MIRNEGGGGGGGGGGFLGEGSVFLLPFIGDKKNSF